MEPNLVPHRTCGTCNVCCVDLTIDDPELRKVQGIPCHNATPAGACTIYDRRPKTCIQFYCGWRHLKWIAETLRPDLSRVLVCLHTEPQPATVPVRTGVMFVLLDARALKAQGLAESVAAAIASDTPTYVNIPGPPGHTAAIVCVNEILKPAVMARDKPAVLALLASMRKQGRKTRNAPVVLDRRNAAPASG